MKSQRTGRGRQRAFGQNFLIDKVILEQLIQGIHAGPGSLVFEIGPGQGALTAELARTGAKVVALERDPILVKKGRLKHQSHAVEWRLCDARTVDINSLLENVDSSSRPIVCGNLPYNQATPIIRHFLPSISHFQHYFFMVQQEVAKRLAAEPGSRDFGALTVFVQCFSKAELQFKISPDAFRPRPKVLSAAITFTPISNPLPATPEFFLFVHRAFSQKRKKLVNSLSPTVEKRELVSLLETLGLKPEVRAEQLTRDEFWLLYQKIPRNQADSLKR